MPFVTVDVVHPNNIDYARHARLPTDKPSSRVARKLAEMMKVPQAEARDDTPFGLYNKRNARKLAPIETLADAGVLDGDTLKLLITAIAGAA